MTYFNTGIDNLNVITGETTFGLDLREQDNDVMDEMKEEVFHIINSLEKLYDLKIDIEIDDEVPAAIINEEAESHLNQAIIEELGKENIQARLQTSGADDFHFYTRSEEHTSELQ